MSRTSYQTSAVLLLLFLQSPFFLHAQIQALAQVETNNHYQEFSQKLSWIKSKIEKYGGKMGNQYSYQVTYSVKNCELYITQRKEGQLYTFTLPLKEFKEIRASGPDIEILANGTSVIGQIGDNKSAWAGIRINKFKLGESSMIERMEDAFLFVKGVAEEKCP